MRLSELQEMLERYRDGKATPEENRLLEVWFLKTEQEPAVFSREELAESESLILERLRARLYEPKKQRGLISRLVRRSFLRVASIIVLISAAGIAAYINRESIAGYFDDVEMKLVESGPYDIKQVRLPDGSLVTLHKNSSVRYPSKYTGKTRELSITGKGYFNVAKDQERPFIVHTDYIDIRVLGTSFLIDDRLQNSLVTVSVISGSVDVSRQQRSLAILTPNKSINYHRNSGRYDISVVEVSALIDWIDKQLVFEKTDLYKVLEALQQQFRVTITVRNDKIKGKVFTGQFTSKDSLKDVMEILAASVGFSYQHVGDSTITINP